MTDDIKRPHRPAAAFALVGLLLIGGCQNMYSMVSPKGGGEGVGASASGETYLRSIRTDHGLPPLARDGKLEKAAAEQAGYMARASAMSHRTGWRKDFATRMKENGIEGAAAENEKLRTELASVTATLEQVRADNASMQRYADSLQGDRESMDQQFQELQGRMKTLEENYRKLGEIAETGMFARSGLPAETDAGTRNRLAELFDASPISQLW